MVSWSIPPFPKNTKSFTKQASRLSGKTVPLDREELHVLTLSKLKEKHLSD